MKMAIRRLRSLAFLGWGDVLLFEHQQHTAPLAKRLVAVQEVTETNVTDASWFNTSAEMAAFRDFLERGDLGFYGYVDRKCIHRSWVKLGPCRINLWRSFSRRIGSKEAYIHYCKTASEVRGFGVYPLVLDYIARHLKDFYSIQRTYVATNYTNVASRRGIQKAGFLPVARYKVLMWWRFPLLVLRKSL